MLFLSGCFALPVEEVYTPPAFFALPEPRPWRTHEVVYGDVEFFTTISATHQPARSEVVRFPAAGVIITGIYVNLGDEVQEGDVIASLDRSDVAGDLERMAREEERLLMQINHINERHEHALWTALTSGRPVDDTVYLNQRRDLLEDLQMLRLELDYLRRQYESRLVRATMDGVVTEVMTFTERQLSSYSHAVALIADQSLSIFVVAVREAQVMNVGDRFEMDVGGSFVWVEVIDPDEIGLVRPETPWQEAILVADGGGVFSPRAIGRIHAVFDTVYDVLYVPFSALHEVNGEHFVYVLEEGVRRKRVVEVGLAGTFSTEITGGLTLGEVVVT